jgi:acetoin utilization deacetylase AcuC-like enzyme
MSIPIAWTEIYAHPLPEGHRFPMEKYDLIPEQLLYEGTIQQEQLFAPTPLTEEQILRVHDASYWAKLKGQTLSKKEQRESGFPLSERLVERETIICNGTVQGALAALNGTQCAFNVAGGTHHAYRDKAEGFCLLNDIALGATELLEETAVKQVLVIDLDVHQGNGTAKIFHKDDRVFTFSMHGDRNYPFRKEQSDVDVPLPDGITDDAFLALLQKHLKEIKDRVKPDFVFFQAGVDILASDKLGKLGVSLQGCQQRDELVFDFCIELGIPLQVSMGGGYSPRIADIVDAHANTYRLAMRKFT